MIYNSLGNSSLKVSAIAVGAMSLDPHEPNIAARLLQKAFDQGITYFDTADLYDKGQNERIVGQSIKPFRKDVVLATKVGNKWREDGSGWDWDVSVSYIEQAIDLSLRRLQTDYIDLYQLHGGTKDDNLEEIIDTMERLVQKGKIRYYGLSSIRPNVFLPFAKQSNMVSNMMQYSVLDTRPEAYFETLTQQQVNILARGSLAQGLLINKDAKSYLSHSLEEVADIQDKLKAIAKANGCSEVTVALSYVLQHPIVASALVGVRNEQQLDDVLQGYQEIGQVNPESLVRLGQKIFYQDHLE